MITFDGKVYRNLEEQVLANTKNLEEIHHVGLLLAQLGIKVVGEAATEEDLPDPAQYHADDREHHYGDAYAVGADTPYYFYIFTRPFEGETDPHWFPIGLFPLPGPKGDKGDPGDSADFDSANFVSSGFNEPNITGTLNLVSESTTKSIPMAVTRPIKPGLGISLSTDAVGVTAPSIELFNHHIIMDENYQDQYLEDHFGWRVEFDVISTGSDAIPSFIDFCAQWRAQQSSDTGCQFPAVGVKTDTPYAGGPLYHNTFPTKIFIEPSTKTATFEGIKIDMGSYDSPIIWETASKSAIECSSMDWTDIVSKIPHIVPSD